MRLAAGRIGQLLNYNSIAADIGVDLKTIKSWFFILETSFIVFFCSLISKISLSGLLKRQSFIFTIPGLPVACLV
ncbi:MAG: DUF4143 domain-containing protein [Fibromonadales bacterium]|nr:DUF4143 domain-containing protein [Fibromonadales bacterium]